MKKVLTALLFLVFIIQTGCGQNAKKTNPNTTKTSQRIGGPCDGCDAIYDCPIPFEQLNWIDTLPDFNEPGPRMVISGIVYMQDGKTPAPGVVLYVYHTDQSGHYTPKPDQKGNSRRHGYIRGWMRTNAKGEYKFYTLKPAAYPNARIPAHIHPILIEPGKNDYYIDEYRFKGDPFLTADEIKKEEGRGGSGIIDLQMKNGVLWGERNIYLGRNIPDYAVVLQAELYNALALLKRNLSQKEFLSPNISVPILIKLDPSSIAI
jgi:protocatechuate 3,4-dioxygenase beta subunit